MAVKGLLYCFSNVSCKITFVEPFLTHDQEADLPLVGVRSRVRELRLKNPHWSLGDIALETGVSRERVRQLLEAEGLPTRRATPRRIFDAALELVPAPNADTTPDTEEDTDAEMGS